MKFLNIILFLTCSSWALMTTAAECPKATVFMGGAYDIELLAATWINGYADVCNHTSFVLEKCGSSCRARNVCDKHHAGEMALNVSLMTHPWADTEATTENGFLYHCAASNRKVMQVKVANDALVFAVASDGVAGECMSILGGLTLDQLRWIYSSHTHAQLVASGWDPLSLSNSDHKDTTHLWSELHPDCAEEEIMISGGHPGTRSYSELRIALMRGDEDIPHAGRSLGHNKTVPYYNSTINAHLVQYLQNHPAAITFLMYSYAVDVADGLTVAPIRNPASKEMVRPDMYTISSGQYHPFSSPVYMNFVNEPHILKAMEPFVEFAFSETGTLLVKPQGFVPIGDWEKTVMLTGLNDGGVSLHDVECGAQSGAFAIGGDDVAFPMAQMWAEIYMDKCTHVNITYDGGSSSQGADRVCAASNFSRVDIGMMTRNFRDSEASTTNGYGYDCVGSDRNVIQIETATQGLTVAVKKGALAEKCIEKLGGLTIDQLRWMFSNFVEADLRDNGWSDDAVLNSDGNPNTKYWSELMDDPACPETQIKIVGPDSLSLAYDFFQGVVLPAFDEGENFATNRDNNKYHALDREKKIVRFLSGDEAAIGFFSHSYSIADDPNVVAIPIQNDAGKFVAPSVATVSDGSYNPLSRKMYLNLVDNRASLALTRPFMKFALSPAGQVLMRKMGYSPLPEAERVIMSARATGESSNDKSGGLSAGAIVGIVILVLAVVLGVAYVLLRKNKASATVKELSIHTTDDPEGGEQAHSMDPTKVIS